MAKKDQKSAPAPEAPVEEKKEPGFVQKVIDAVFGEHEDRHQRNERDDLQKHPKFAKFKQGEK